MASLRIELIALALIGCAQVPPAPVVQIPVPVPTPAYSIPSAPAILSQPISETDDPVTQCVARLRACSDYKDSLLELLK